MLDWLSNITRQRRSTSAPPSIDLSMSQQTPFVRPQNSVPSAPSSAASSKIQTDDPTYPSVLFGNGLIMDRSGTLVPQAVSEFLVGHILKSRALHLANGQLQNAVRVAANVMDSSEQLVHKIFRTAMFPTTRQGVVEGSGTSFTKEPLPATGFWGELSVPRPDIHLGFSTGQSTDFTMEQYTVITHPFAKPYTSPTTDNTFPFLIVEVKSETKGATLWHAENQAAGGGAHRVNSMQWLYRQAELEPDAIKTLAFSICLTARQAILYVHYYHSESKQFRMSSAESYSTTQANDIQKCNWHIQNILDFAVSTRRTQIEGCLNKLYPIPEWWRLKKKRGSAASTPTASFSGASQG